MSASSLSYVCEKEECGGEVDKTTSDLPKIVQGGFLTVDGDPVCEGGCVFLKGVHFYYFIFCFLLRLYQLMLQRNR